MTHSTRQFNLRRDFFVVNSAGDNEFDWVLTQLGFSEEEASEIQSVIVDIEVTGEVEKQ